MTDDKKRQVERVAAENGVYVQIPLAEFVVLTTGIVLIYQARLYWRRHPCTSLWSL